MRAGIGRETIWRFEGLSTHWRQYSNLLLPFAPKLGGHGPIVHFDRGAHYHWPEWLARTEGVRLNRFVSRKKCFVDNAADEAFFGRFKNELVYPSNWQGISIDKFMRIFQNYVGCYNEKPVKISD